MVINMKAIFRKKKNWLPLLVTICLLIVFLVLAVVKKQVRKEETYERLSPTFEEITFSDFGIKDGTYTFNEQRLSTIGELSEGYLNRTFVGTVNFSETAMTTINFAGKNSGWEGVMLHTSADGVRFSDNHDQFESILIVEEETGAKLTDNDVEVMLSFEMADIDGDGDKDDVCFWLYFDGVLYQNKPIVEAKDYANYLGGYLSIYSNKATSSVTIQSKELSRPAVKAEEVVMPPKAPELEEITFGDFGIADGTYSYDNKSLATEGTIESGYANKTFVGTINFSSGETTYLRFAGKKSGWEGVILYTTKAGLVFEDNSGSKKQFTGVAITQTEVSAPLKGRDIEFKLSFEVIDIDSDGGEDDVRFWLYFEGELYKDKPIVEAIDYAQYLGTYLGIYSNSAASRVDIKSKDLNRPLLKPQVVLNPPTFEEITFSDFNIADGTYFYDNNKFAALGQYDEGYQDKTFVGIVNFSSATPTYIRFAGKNSGWEGVALYSTTNGLVFVDPAEKGSRFKGTTITDITAGMKLTDNDLEIALSFEVTDLDGDKQEDDVRFWLWLNGELYRNKPIAEAMDYIQYLGSYLSICSTKEASHVTVLSQ